jgi:putative membrane protein
MLVRKNISLKSIMNFSGHHLLWLTAWMGIFTTLYYYTEWRWLRVPWMPISVVGTAVAFYVGFKNNQAYDRLWESRKIWGAIVNNSRIWASMVSTFLGKENQNSIQKLVYGYIAWTYTLRSQLLQPTQWEHVSLRYNFGTFNQKRRENSGEGMYNEEVAAVNLEKYLNDYAPKEINGFSNQSTYIIHEQGLELEKQTKNGAMGEFKHMQLQRILNDCYENQGKLERLKKFPLPRQYGSFSFIFVCIFIFLLPFGIVSEFNKIGEAWIWISIPFGVVVGWIYVTMELIGDYSENPFEGLPYDVPMLSICRTIEIDSLNIIGDKEVPAPIQPKNEVLM